MTPSEKVYKMFSFQYKPIELALLNRLSDDDKKKYKSYNYTRKIMILDNVARTIGL